jgi:hypothetical protein
VDHGGHAGDRRREAADESGLGGVGVDDRRLLARDQPEELREGGQVGDGGDLAPERRNVDDAAAAPARVIER